jgi:hypothetical protein
MGQDAVDRAASSPRDGREQAERLLDQAGPVLAALGAVLPDGHPVLESARDEVADRIMRCAVQYGNETKDWTAVKGLLERAGAAATSEAVRSRVRANLETVRENQAYATCWFCHDRPGEDDAAYEQKMYGEVRQEPVHSYYSRQIRTTWRKLTVKVPRCGVCAHEHATRDNRLWGFGCTGAVVVLTVAIVLMTAGHPLLGVLLIVADVVGFLVVASKTNTAGLPDASYRTLRDYPLIKEQLAAGWQYGEAPPGTSS